MKICKLIETSWFDFVITFNSSRNSAGYMLGERLLRPALVAVAKRKISENDEKIEKKDNK